MPEPGPQPQDSVAGGYEYAAADILACMATVLQQVAWALHSDATLCGGASGVVMQAIADVRRQLTEVERIACQQVDGLAEEAGPSRPLFGAARTPAPSKPELLLGEGESAGCPAEPHHGEGESADWPAELFLG